MPELPEVETVRGQLEKFLVGHKVLNVKVRMPKIFSGNSKNLIGGKIKSVRRFAKVLSIDLSNGFSVVIHIKLTGQLIYRGPNLSSNGKLSKKVVGGVPGPHSHVVFQLDRDGILYYNDVRRFGWLKVVKTSEVEKMDFIGKLGPEPLDGLTVKAFSTILASTKKAIKVLLMDQAKIGGVGNIYANDALWLAGIAPTRAANSLTVPEQTKLFKAIEKVLKEGLKRGGASELSFVTPDGGEGSYQKHFLAYGQNGKTCPRCKKGKFKKTMLGGRGTYFCSTCQK